MQTAKASRSSWTETWTPGSRTREARLALPREVQASCPGSWVHALWDPPASLQSPRWLCWVFLFIPSSACQPPSLAPLSAQSSPALRGHTQAGTRGVGPGAEEAAALLLDPGWAPGGCPPTSGSPEDPGSTEALWPGPCTCLHPLHVTQPYCLASMTAWLSSTGISHHSLLSHIPWICLSIPGTGEPGGLPSMGSHRVGHD